MMIKKLSVLIMLLGASFIWINGQSNPINKVEPPFWWTEMKDNSLQLMVYGKSIGNSSIKINSDKVVFESAQQVENKNYLFINLTIKKHIEAGIVPIEFQLNGKSFFYNYELKQRRPNADKKPVMDASDVVYLITPDRFVNGDPSNDNVKGFNDKLERTAEYGRHGGDIQGIIDNIDYIKKLGMTAVWPMPLLENNQDAFSYHGYAISDFYETDKRFGDNALYKKLADKLHENGLKLVMDQVFNHCGSAYWWMKDLPMKDWINDAEEFGRSNFNNMVVSDPYVSQKDKNEHYRGYFDTNMPDLNLANPIFARYMIQNSVWWIEFANIDALRIDTYPYIDKNFSAKWRQHIEKEYPGMFVTAEVWVSQVPYEAYWNSSKPNFDGYQSHINSITDFPLYYSMLKAFGKNGDISALHSCLSKDFLYGQPEMNLIFFDNHDVSRTFGELGGDYEKYKLAATFIFTTRGIPQWYYGSEILMKATGSHGYIREDMPGGWAGDKKNVFKGENMTVAENAALDFITDLLSWRKTSRAIKEGNLIHFLPHDNVYVYFRTTDNEILMVILNNGEEKLNFSLKNYQEVLQGHKTGTDVLSKETFDLSKPISIKAKTPYIISIN
ncbi:MAG: alpha-amylase family glycosyl hydrolase [Bacteroidales bacterium]|nr:alpha-amylase family glycosyl hydrolase [Bacteroidales bacterium]